MTKNTHTPGPWSIDPDALKAVAVVTRGGRLIADVYSPTPDNALLVAAAPELLASLIDLLSMIESPQISVSGVVGGQWEVTKKEARAAIAKATGQ